MTWYDSDYGYKKKITIDNTKVAGDETDFPVLISVTDNDLRDEANGGHVKHASGWDIIFTNSAETVQLKHEIERYVNTSGLLVFWVKVSSLSSTADTDIYIYYGKAGVGADPSTTDTWDSNFKAVYHMDDATGVCDDSTVNANDGAYQGDLPDRVTGKTGYGQDFDGDGDYIDLPSGANIGIAGTFECWYESDVTGNNDILWHQRQDSNDYILTGVGWTGSQHRFISELAGSTQIDIEGMSQTTSWEKWSCAYQLNDAELRIDTTSIGTDASVPVTAWSYGIITVGKHATLTYYVDGVMDEVRISDVRRSNNWLDTTYKTQNDPAGFMSWSAEEEKPVSEVGAAIYYHDGTNNIELQRDDSSPVQMFNGTTIIGLKLGATNHANASPFHVYDGTTIKAILKMP